MELAVRQIVSRLGTNVATKKKVCQEYCKEINVQKLSSAQKTEIQRVISCIIEELIAKPETLNEKQRVSLQPASISSNSVTNGRNSHLQSNDLDENAEMRDSDVDNLLSIECASSIQRLLGEQEDQGNVIKKVLPSPTMKKRVVRRIRSKDVLDSILDSNDENCCESPLKSPKKLKCISDTIIDEDLPSMNQRPPKRACEEVIDSIIDSDSSADAEVLADEDFSSKTASPTKSLLSVCEDSPLIQPKLSSKRKIFLSDSESDVGEYVVNSKSQNVAQKYKLKRRCIQLDSDSDSEGISSDDISSKVSKKNPNGSFSQKSKSKKIWTDYGNNTGVKNCKVVVEDCLPKSRCEMGEKLSTKSGRMTTISHSKRKRSLSCSSEDLDNTGSLSASESEDVLSGNVNVGMNKDDSNKRSSSVLSANATYNEGKKKKQEPHKKESKKVDSKQLKDLRAICRHVGVILRNTIELQGCDTDEEKIRRIKSILRDKGMKGRPSMKSAEQFNLERELKELGVSSSDAGSKSPIKASRRRTCRGDNFTLTTSSTVTVAASDDFSHMKDIFCADESSDCD